MNLSDLIEEFNVVIDTAEGLSELRTLILGLAVRGKLVPQDPNDEPASELLKKIETEIERLYEKDEVRKPKDYPAVKEDERPFEIPDSWVWARNGNLILFQNGYAFKSGHFQDSGIGVIRIGNLQNGQVIEDSMKYISEEYASEVKNDYLIRQGDMLIAMSGATTGKLAINNSDKTYLLNQRVGKIDPIFIDQDYLYRYLNTKIEENLAKSSGSAIPNLSTKQIGELEIPLPPLAEQHRIVQKIETLFAEVDELEAKLNRQSKLDEKLQMAVNAEVQQAPDAEASKSAWTFITTNFNTLYHSPEAIENLKKNILNEAVRGRLVPQNPNDEPASELLKKIEAEKQRLYEEGDIRKPKKIETIKMEDLPFEIPEKWEWCRLGNICDFITSGSTPKKDEFVDNGIPFLKVYNIRKQKIDFDYKPQFISEDVHHGSLDRSKLYPGNVIMNIVGPPLGKVAIIPDTYPEWNCNQAIVVFRPFIQAINSYLYQFLRAQTFLLGIELIGTAGQDNISVTKSNNIEFPLPPLEEQRRIVRRIEELFAICDRFKAQLGQRKAVNERLVKGLVGEVLEGSSA